MFLGIDLGTSSVRCTVINDEGRVIDSRGKSYHILSPAPGFAEQDPAIWWDSVRHCIQSLSTTINLSEIKAIGFSGQMHGGVFLDCDGEPVCNSIIWADGRTSGEVLDIKARAGEKKLFEICHSPVATGFPLPNLLWLRSHRPDVYKKIRYVISAKDYIRYRLCGEIGCEISDASATLLCNVERGEWSQHLCSLFDIDSTVLPEISLPGDIAGRVTLSASQQTGLKAGTICVYGAADQVMQSLGCGIISAGELSVTLGTGGQVLTIVDHVNSKIEKSAHCFSFLDKTSWYCLGASLNGASTLEWVRERCGNDSFDYINREASKISPGSDGLIFLPYINGERTPLMDSAARGCFFGLSRYHTKAHLYRATMEGICFALTDALETIKRMSGHQIECITVSGGATNSDLWVSMMADIFNVPVKRAPGVEHASLGAALCAAVGSGAFSSFQQVCNTVFDSSNQSVVYPHKPDKYRRYLEIFHSLYSATSSLMHECASLR